MHSSSIMTKSLLRRELDWKHIHGGPHVSSQQIRKGQFTNYSRLIFCSLFFTCYLSWINDLINHLEIIKENQLFCTIFFLKWRKWSEIFLDFGSELKWKKAKEKAPFLLFKPPFIKITRMPLKIKCPVQSPIYDIKNFKRIDHLSPLLWCETI